MGESSDVNDAIGEAAEFLGVERRKARKLLLAVGARTLQAYLREVDKGGQEVYTTGVGGIEGEDEENEQ